MSDQRSVACRVCRRIILPVTAKATGGLCRACDRDEGRKNAVAAAVAAEVRASQPITRDDLASLRLSPRSESAFNALLEKLTWRWHTYGVGGLNVHQRTVLAVELFLAEVLNGGMSQFLDHDSGQFANDVPDSLTRLGLHDVATPVREFLAHFQQPLSPDAETRWQQLEQVELLHGDEPLARVNDQIFGLFTYRDYPALLDRMCSYVLTDPLQFAWQPVRDGEDTTPNPSLQRTPPG
jgi:hypothetical protein